MLALVSALAPTAGVAAVPAKGVTGFFGATGTAAGQLNTPRGVAVNQTNGNVYAVDGSNNRIAVFDSNGKFLRAFGADVVAYGPDQANEAQVLAVAATGGNFTLTFSQEKTPSIPAMASAAQVQSALNALGTISTGGGSVTVTGGPGNATGSTPYRITFDGGPLAATDVSQIAPENVDLAGGSPASTATVRTANAGQTGFEICLPANGDACKAGTSSPTGGAMSGPQGVAVDQATGDVYVTNQGNRRIERFDQNGNFVSAFGLDVVETGFPGNSPEASAVQTLTVTATEGKYTLEFGGQKTAELPYNSNAAAIQTALTGLASIGAGNATVLETSAGVFKVTFAGNLASNPEPLILAASAAGEPLVGGTATVANTTTGSSGYEVCVLANNDVCKAAPFSGTTGGAFNNSLGYPAVAPAGAPNAGNLLVADSANLRVQEFTSSGAFVRAFGFDVAKGGPGNTGTAFEVCALAAGDACKVGVTGSGSGQFGTGTPTRIAEDASGNVYTVEPAVNFRVQKFTLPGNVVTPQGVFDEADLKGTASSNAPTDVAVNPANSNVLVNKAFAAGATASCPITGAASVAESRVLEVSSGGTLEGTHGTCAGMTPVNGLGIRGSSGHVNVSSTFGASRVYVLNTGQPVAPTLLITNVSGVDAHSATVNALVNPGGPELPYGQETTYAIEYKRSTDAGFVKLANTEASAGNRTTNKAIAVAVGGLQPNTSYDVRLTANKGLGSGSASQTVSFQTEVSVPDLNLPEFVTMDETKARLLGSINPNNQSTSYHFEYVDQAGFEANGFTGATQVPAVDAGAGSGGVAVSAIQAISGLTPGATYHYRLVAANPSGQRVATGTFAMPDPGACPNAQLRAEQASATLPAGSTYLPDCMALEMVTPPKKYNQGVSRPKISLTGDQVLFNSFAALAETPNLAFIENLYVSRRTATGWASYTPRLPISLSVGKEKPCSFSMDLSRYTQWARPPGTAGTRVLAPYAGGAEIAPYPLGPTLFPLNTGTNEFVLCAGGSVDGSRFIFQPAGTAYLPGDPVGPGASFEGNSYEAYIDAAGDPTVDLLTRDKNGKIWGGACGADVGWHSGPSLAIRGAISPDTSWAFFTSRPTQGSGGCATASNMRRVMQRLRTPAGPEISTVSSSECTRVSPPCDLTDRDDNFKAASREGDKVFFLSGRQLTNSDLDTGTGCVSAASAVGCDLYLYDASRPAGSRLTQISAGDATDPTPGKGAEVRGVADVAGDGSHAYFVANGVLTTTPNALGRSAEAGKPNLYLYERDGTFSSGRTVFIGTLESTDSNTWGNHGPGMVGSSAVPILGSDTEDLAVGGDGHVLVFEARAGLVPDDTDGRRDLYRYDSDTRSLERISVAAPGGSDNGAFDVTSHFGWAEEYAMPQDIAFNRWVSNNGRTVVFITSEALDPNDTDGKATAYIWHDGTITAVRSSVGTGALAQQPGMVSMSGNEVAFVSAAPLLPEDGDQATDIYVARVDGGFPLPVPPVLCQGEACQGPPPPQPGELGSASEAPTAGNVTEVAKCKRGFVRRNGRCVRKPGHRKKATHKSAHKRHANTNRRAGQ